MAKIVQVLLNKPLTIHLSRDNVVTLQAGLQEVDQEVAEHWYVKAHAQEITSSDIELDDAKKEVESVKADLSTAQAQLESAATQISTLTADVETKDAEIAALKAQLESATSTSNVTETKTTKEK